MSKRQKGELATSRPAITQPLKWHRRGGKHYLASKIIELMPPHIHYVEPYAGGLSVMLAKDPEGVSEVANDLNGFLACFWRAMMNPELFAQFQRRVEGMPFAEQLWNAAHEAIEDETLVTRDETAAAVALFVCCRQSLAGRMTDFAPLSRTRTRRGMNEQASAWMNAVDGLPAVHARLRRVAILNRPALDVIHQQDGPDTLFYLDPPYLHDTRSTKTEYGQFEMSKTEHTELLEVIALDGAKSKFMLSGYRSELYDSTLDDWNRHDFELPNNSAGGKSKRRMVECVWCNF